MAAEKSLELTVEEHPRIITDTSGESSSSSKNNILRKADEVAQQIFSPVVEVATAAVDAFIPKIQRVPWYHFFSLSFFVAVP